jgi:putative FmdB family regulatory protein
VPTYQYACTECNHAFEQFQSFSEDALTVCPECQGRLRKKFNAVGVVFKGSGFYRTDSRASAGADGKGSSKSGDAAPAKSTSESTGTSESSGSGEKKATAGKDSASTKSSTAGTTSAA